MNRISLTEFYNAPDADHQLKDADHWRKQVRERGFSMEISRGSLRSLLFNILGSEVTATDSVAGGGGCGVAQGEVCGMGRLVGGERNLDL